MKLNNFAVSVMDFFVKLSFWVILIPGVLIVVGSLSEGSVELTFYALLFLVVALLIWAILSAGWLVLSKIAAHLESIDQKTPNVRFGFDTGEGDSETVGEPEQKI